MNQIESSASSNLEALLEQAVLSRSEQWPTYFARHSRSFSFAARFFPVQQRQMVAGVYAYSRFTDDIVDGEHQATLPQRKEMLALWQTLSKQAYESQDSGIFLLDHVLGNMAFHRVPFVYAQDLIEGMRMDLELSQIPDTPTLYLYAYRVASAIGLWLTELFGIHDPWMLSRAAALGEAMQLTNILRDVGEDLGRQRVYLPQDRMKTYGVDIETLQHARPEQSLPENYQRLIEELLQESEQRYEDAMAAIPGLPEFFQKPVMVAAYVYRGIHKKIRANRYDNLHQRASTSWWDKVRLTWQGLRRLHREKQQFPLRIKSAIEENSQSYLLPASAVDRGRESAKEKE